MPQVTALRARARGRIEVELDGAAWRTVPAEAVLRAGLDVGRELDREHARALRRELVRLRALSVATSALRRRDLSEQALAARLSGAGTAPSDGRRAIDALARAGLVDDARAALARARSLAERGYGDGAIAADLERRSFATAACAEALAALPPEDERLEPILARRGIGPQTGRYVAARGFGEDSIARAAGADFANEP
jgi:SOS response regulatory protein OraA/RecX